MYDCIICARGNSKGIPGKNLRKLWGKTLIELCVNKAKRSKTIRYTYVSTEDPQIALHAKRAGATRVINRDPNLSQDHIRQVDVVKHLLTNLDDKCDPVTNTCFLLQTTTPFITEMDIDQATKFLQAHNGVQLLSVSSTTINPTSLYMKYGDTITPIYQKTGSKQRQGQQRVFEANGGIRLFNVAYLLEYGEFFNGDAEILGYEIPRTRSLNLDEMVDWHSAVKMAEGR